MYRGPNYLMAGEGSYPGEGGYTGGGESGGDDPPPLPPGGITEPGWYDPILKVWRTFWDPAPPRTVLPS